MPIFSPKRSRVRVGVSAAQCSGRIARRTVAYYVATGPTHSLVSNLLFQPARLVHSTPSSDDADAVRDVRRINSVSLLFTECVGLTRVCCSVSEYDCSRAICKPFRSYFDALLERGFQPPQRTQRIYELTQRKERNEMTSLLDRPITAASDDSICRCHADKLWQTRAKLLKLNLI